MLWRMQLWEQNEQGAVLVSVPGTGCTGVVIKTSGFSLAVSGLSYSCNSMDATLMCMHQAEAAPLIIGFCGASSGSCNSTKAPAAAIVPGHMSTSNKGLNLVPGLK